MSQMYHPDELFEHNINQINSMNVAAGSMIKGLIMELERKGRATYIRLRDAKPEGHTIKYDLQSGDPKLVVRIATALGIAVLSDNTLEIPHG